MEAAVGCVLRRVRRGSIARVSIASTRHLDVAQLEVRFPSGDHKNDGTSGGGIDLGTISSTCGMVGRVPGFGLLHARLRSTSCLASSAAASNGLKHEREAAGGGRRGGSLGRGAMGRGGNRFASSASNPSMPKFWSTATSSTLAVQPPHPFGQQRAARAAEVTGGGRRGGGQGRGAVGGGGGGGRGRGAAKAVGGGARWAEGEVVAVGGAQHRA